MMFWKRKKNVRPQLGELLFDLAMLNTTRFVNDEETLKEADLDSINPDRLVAEILLLNMFLIIEFAPDVSEESLDDMHDVYYRSLVEQLHFDQDQIRAIHERHSFMYEKYHEALHSGGNYVEALARTVAEAITNQRVSLYTLTSLLIAQYIANVIQFITKVVKEYEVK